MEIKTYKGPLGHEAHLRTTPDASGQYLLRCKYDGRQTLHKYGDLAAAEKAALDFVAGLFIE